MKFTRRRLLSGIAAPALALSVSGLFEPLSREAEASWHHGIPPVTKGGMLMNTSGATYFSGQQPILNWWNAGSKVTVYSSLNGNLVGAAAWNAVGTASAGGGTAYFNPATGDLNNPCPSDVTAISRGFFTPPPNYNYLLASSGGLIATPWWYGQVFYITWLGTSTPTSIESLGAGGSFVVTGANTATLTLGTTGPGNVDLSFPVANYSSPPTGIKVFQSQYAAAVAAGEFFNPDYLAEIRPFGVVRFMNWGDITNGGGMTAISQLADANYNAFTAPMGGSASFTGAISGTTLTVTGLIGAEVGNLLPNMALTDPAGLVAPGTVILSSIDGGGSNGTYLVNNSQSVAAETMLAVGIAGTFNGQYGPKGGVHPSLICQLANLTGCNVHYCVPNTISDAAMTAIAAYFYSNLNPKLWVKFEYGNENWNIGQGNFYYCSYQIYPGSGLTGYGASYAGYRAAQLWALVYAVYGAGGRARWRGALGSQVSDTGTTLSGISGALYAINNPSTSGIPSGFTLTQLFDEVDVAPYWGDQQNQANISAIGVGSTTTVTAPNSYTAGMVVRLFLAGGTLAAAFNNVDVTVATASTSSFTFTNYGGNSGSASASTAGLVWAGTISNITWSGGVVTVTTPTPLGFTGSFLATLAGNTPSGYNGTSLFCIVTGASTFTYSLSSNPGSIVTNGTFLGGYTANGLMFDLMDDSLTNFQNTPATYPTQFTYFAEQIAQSVITGAASNGFATASNINTTLATELAQEALIANSYGLELAFYEGGANFPGFDQSSSSTPGLWGADGIGGQQQFLSYALNFQWDATQSGPYTIGTCYAAYTAACNAVNSPYPAQFVDTGQDPTPWMNLRYFPGDEGNPKWQACLTQNALGPWVDPTIATGITPSFITSNFVNSTTSAQTLSSVAFGSNPAGLVIIACTGQNGPAISSVTIQPAGITITNPDVAINASGVLVVGSSATVKVGIFSAIVPANLGNQTIVINWTSAAFLSRDAAVFLLANPNSDSIQSYGTATVAEIKQSCIVAAQAASAGTTWSAGTNGLIAPFDSTTHIPSGGLSSFAVFQPPFSSKIMNVTSTGSGSTLLATYR